MLNVKDPQFIAAVTLIGRMGATHFQIRYSSDPPPTVWMTDARWQNSHAATGGMTPLQAALRLLDVVVDGGQCAHCGQRTLVMHDFASELPELVTDVCWYIYDPEVKVYRRSCEAEMPGDITVGRNDPCPCGSGKKFKQCHG